LNNLNNHVKPLTELYDTWPSFQLIEVRSIEGPVCSDAGVPGTNKFT
jgi:hypothetical protein